MFEKIMSKDRHLKKYLPLLHKIAVAYFVIMMLKRFINSRKPAAEAQEAE
jgi:hypothetical protein